MKQLTMLLQPLAQKVTTIYFHKLFFSMNSHVFCSTASPCTSRSAYWSENYELNHDAPSRMSSHDGTLAWTEFMLMVLGDETQLGFSTNGDQGLRKMNSVSASVFSP
jgi:hypothetical protein